MTTSKYHDTSHMSKLERNLTVLQDHSKTHAKDPFITRMSIRECTKVVFHFYCSTYTYATHIITCRYVHALEDLG